MHQGSQRFVLTGGIGSGKSFVGALLAERGWVIVEADRIGHEVLEPDGSAYASVSRRWPEVLREGRIDRRALGLRVFGSEADLAELESFTHPAIRAAITERVGNDDKLAVEIPLLTDWLVGWPSVVVDASDETRWSRLRGRGMTDDEIVTRLAAQPTRQEWLDAADFVVNNDAGADLGGQLDRLETWVGQQPSIDDAS